MWSFFVVKLLISVGSYLKIINESDAVCFRLGFLYIYVCVYVICALYKY